MTDKAPRIKKSRGRPVTQEIKIDGTPDEVARAIFSAVNPPNPWLKVTKKSDEAKLTDGD